MSMASSGFIEKIVYFSNSISRRFIADDRLPSLFPLLRFTYISISWVKYRCSKNVFLNANESSDPNICKKKYSNELLRIHLHDNHISIMIINTHITHISASILKNATYSFHSFLTASFIFLLRDRTKIIVETILVHNKLFLT